MIDCTPINDSIKRFFSSLFAPDTASPVPETTMKYPKQFPRVYPPLPIFVDIPDVDNVLLCLSRLSSTHPEQKFNIVLTPRPVDLKARRYDDLKSVQRWKTGDDGWFVDGKGVRKQKDFVIEQLSKAAGDSRAAMVAKAGGNPVKPFLDFKIRPLKDNNMPSWLGDIEAPDLRELFAEADKGFGDGDIRRDTEKYMQLSAYRFADFLRSVGIDIRDGRFNFFWDMDSMDSIKPAMRHCNHVPDYTYGFELKLLTKYGSAVQEEDADRRRQALLGIWMEYINAQEKETGIKPENIIKPYSAFLDAQASDDHPRPLLIGGPFTEALKYLKKGLKVSRVTAMALYKRGDRNVLPNQFNVACDIPAAEEFMEFAKTAEFDTIVVSTECIKDEGWKLGEKEFEEIFQDHKRLLDYIQRFVYQSETLDSAYLYDWITAALSRADDLFVKKICYPHLKKDDPDALQDLLLVDFEPKMNEKTQRPETSKIYMCLTEGDADFIANYKRRVVKLLKDDLRVSPQKPKSILPPVKYVY